MMFLGENSLLSYDKIVPKFIRSFVLHFCQVKKQVNESTN